MFIADSAALHANALCASTGVSSALDTSDWEGKIYVLLDATAQGSGITNALKVTECATSGGTYTDVTGGGFTTVANTASRQVIELNVDDCMRYLKLDKTVAGGTGTGYVSAQIFGQKKYR